MNTTAPLRDLDTGELPRFVNEDWLDPADVVLEAPHGLVPEERPTTRHIDGGTRGRKA